MKRLIPAVLGIVVLSVSLGCGGEAPPANRSPERPRKPERPPDAPTDLDAIPAFVAKAPGDPEGLAKWAGGHMSRVYTESAAAVEGKPAPDELRPKLEAIYDRYGRLFVAVGRRREAMSDQDRAVFDEAMRLEMIRTATRTERAQAELRKVNSHYSDADKETWRVLTYMSVVNSFWRLETVGTVRGAAERFGVEPSGGR